jgi:Helicase conserved C-terminal domain
MSQSVAVAGLVEDGKRGELFGGALTEEALDSSRSVLGVHRGLRLRGLQQFYTPPQAAGFVKEAIDPLGRMPVLDPTAGNGALLAPWPREQRFGVEIDGDQMRRGDYQAIQGDVQRAFPMLRKLGVQFPQVVANPPFGLTWTDGTGRAENSTVAVWRMGLALLAPDGVGAFICGRDRFRREILSREDAAGVFATVECNDLFDGVALPCLIAFFVGPEERIGDGGLVVEAECSREEFGERALSHEIKDALRRAGRYTGAFSPARVGPVSPWKLVGGELERRRREQARERPTYDIELCAGDRLSIRPGPFVRQALAKAGRLKLVETLHNQPVGHFALNALDWRMLGELERECDLSIAPAVREAVTGIASAAELEVVPLYEVRPQMRLGYLTDLDSILCTRSDPEHGFREGARYPLRTDSRINVKSGEKVTRNKDGEPVVRKYEEEAKVLVIRVAEKEFTESTEDIQYLLDHFEIPNPGDIATRFPEEVQRQRELLDEIAAEGRASGSTTGFGWKRFQREDLARALTKTREGGGFILSWEQGGGKTLGAAGYAQGAVRNGARNQVLFIVPQDLIPQYRQDISANLGIDVEHIATPADARRVERRKRDFGEPIVPCTLKTVRTPMGVAQHELYKHWLSKARFASFFEWKYPEHPLVASGQIERFAAACGQLTKLEYATTAPEAATDRGWPGLAGLQHSNWTPKNMKTLELILQHAKAGEKILVGSDLIETGRWLCDRLLEKGVRAGHIVEERNGKPATVNPKKRAVVMRDFRHGDLQVLLCGIPAIRLGHNLDTASVVVVDGLVFSYEMFDQFIARAHRLSSRNPVTVYVMLTKGSLDEKKWALLSAKAAAADLALDGQLMDEREEPISLEQVLKDLQAQGVPLTGEEIAEAEMRAAWQAATNVIPLVPRPRPVEPVKPLGKTVQLELFAA